MLRPETTSPVTPHLAFDSKESLDRIRATTAEIVRAFAEGRVLNAVPVG